MHRNIIQSNLYKPNVNIFEEIIKGIEYEFSKPVSSISEMKERDNKKRKGDIWESFCKDWLLASGKYINVWLLNEYNDSFPHNNFISKQDDGIDIIAQSSVGWDAIQCKYRRKGKVTWKSLSTFIALCSRTGPPDDIHHSWNKFIVMTNSHGISHKLPRTHQDKSICFSTFKNTKLDHWRRMVGLNVSSPHIISSVDIDFLRQQRLKFFQ